MHVLSPRFACGAVAGIGVAFGVFAVPARADLLTHHDLPYAVALTIAQGAVESCAAKGYPESAVVVDRDGETIVAIRGDNAGPHTMENARRKAYTAVTFKVSTTDYAKRFADNNPVVRQQVTLPNVIAIPGGLPIKVGDEVVGGIGASGSPGVDEACVQAGLDKAAVQLK
ncbi:MAG: heme-binding protein [Rhodopila sp.]|nr:heme-binding protein [Rhodopila sp.]